MVIATVALGEDGMAESAPLKLLESWSVAQA
jgi:hypothetical protein